jgi:hypothetical protein
MVKVITIRDPKTGTLIAEEPIQPKEDEDSALARIYRKTLGPGAPEFIVMSRSVWLDDREWAAEVAKNWGSFGLVVLVAKNEPRLEESKLVLASVTESEPVARMEFPMHKDELNPVRSGQTHDTVVILEPGESLHVGDTVTFYRVGYDPFGEVHRVPDGDRTSVEIKEIRLVEKWGSRGVYEIGWDPAQVTVLMKKGDARKRK